MILLHWLLGVIDLTHIVDEQWGRLHFPAVAPVANVNTSLAVTSDIAAQVESANVPDGTIPNTGHAKRLLGIKRYRTAAAPRVDLASPDNAPAELCKRLRTTWGARADGARPPGVWGSE